VNSVTLSSPPATFAGNTNYTITDSSGSGTLRISPASNLVGTAPPAGAFSVNALVGQFDATAPFDSGYQLFPRSTSDLLTAGQPPANIATQAGTPQSAQINTAFTTLLKALVTDASSAPVAGVAVTFTAPASGASGTFSGSTTVMTDAGGVATAPPFTANATPGTYTVTATINALTANFSLTNTVAAPVATNIAVFAGSPQSAAVTTPFATALQVRVTDASTNPVGGVSVTFTAPGSGASGTFSGSATVTTNGSGIATAPAFTANQTAGSYNVTATAGALSTTLALTNVAGGAANLVVTAGSPQSAVINTAYATALQVRLTDAFSNPIAGATIVFILPGGGASGTFTGFAGNATVTTDSNGLATAPTFTANGSSGGFAVQAETQSGALQATFSLSNVADPNAPANFFIVAGSPQSTQINTPFATALQMKVTNISSTPLSGVSVSFSVPGSGASGTFTGSTTVLTGANGIATAPPLTANGITGTRYVTATAGTLVAQPQFTNTAPPPPPATHFSVTGPATATPGTQFTITVTALDASNAVVTGYTGFVNFSSSSAGSIPGTYQFIASDHGTQIFPVTLTTQGPQTISVTDGTIGGTANVMVICPPAPATVIVSAPNGVCLNSTGNTASVTATAASYLWLITNGTITAGQGSPSITFTAGASGLVQINVGLSNAYGCALGIGSATVPIRTAPTASIAAGGSIHACAGSVVGIPVTLTGTAPFTIVWSDGLTQSGITTTTVTRSVTATTSRIYSITSVTDAGCGTGTSTGGASILVTTAPAITQQPASITQRPGERVNLSVVATGGNLTIEWYEGEVGDQSHLVGTGANVTTLPQGRSTKFWARIFNDCGLVRSNAAVITVIPPGRGRIAGH